MSCLSATCTKTSTKPAWKRYQNDIIKKDYCNLRKHTSGVSNQFSMTAFCVMPFSWRFPAGSLQVSGRFLSVSNLQETYRKFAWFLHLKIAQFQKIIRNPILWCRFHGSLMGFSCSACVFLYRRKFSSNLPQTCFLHESIRNPFFEATIFFRSPTPCYFKNWWKNINLPDPLNHQPSHHINLCWNILKHSMFGPG